jgi:hypothetical protein
MDSGGIVIKVDGSYGHVFLDCLHPRDIIFPISVEYFGFLYFGSFS